MKLPALLALLATGCQSSPLPAEDWTQFYEHQPTSILVLPALNETAAVEAPIAFGSTITHPLAERGYYVFPVQPTLEILEENGIYEGGQLEAIEPQKFQEILGADALLYVTLRAWDNNYGFFGTSFEVALDYRLVDARTGERIWEQSERRVQDVNAGGGPLDLLITPLLVNAVNTNWILQVQLVRQANVAALRALPPGPLSTEHAKVRQALLARSKPVPAKPKP